MTTLTAFIYTTSSADALPKGTILRTCSGNAVLRGHSDGIFKWRLTGEHGEFSTEALIAISGPLTILYRPEESL